jgi:hypothetical protein
MTITERTNRMMVPERHDDYGNPGKQADSMIFGGVRTWE